LLRFVNQSVAACDRSQVGSSGVGAERDRGGRTPGISIPPGGETSARLEYSPVSRSGRRPVLVRQ